MSSATPGTALEPIAETGRRRWLGRLPGGLAADSLGYFLSKLVPGIAGFLSVPLFIRLLGLEQYGRYAVLLPILLAFAGAGSGWLAQGVLRFHPTPASSAQVWQSFHQALATAALLSILITDLVLVIVLRFSHYSPVATAVGVAFCFALLTYTVVLAKLQAELRPASVVLRETLRSLGGVLLATAILWLAPSRRFEWLILGLAIGYAIPLTLDAPSLLLPSLRSRHSASTIRQIWRFGWPVGIWLLVFQLLPVIDRTVIQRAQGFSKAGIYSSLYDLCIRSFTLLAFPFTQAAHPRIMRCCNAGEYSEAYTLIRRSITYQALIFVPIIALTLFFSRQFAHLVIGLDDPNTGTVLPLLVLGGFLWQVSLLAHKPLEIYGETRLMLAGIAAVGVIELIADYALVPRFGYPSAAAVLVGCAMLYLAYCFLLARFHLSAKRPAVFDVGGGGS